MTHKYEKVEGMTVGQVVDAELSGVNFYIDNQDGNKAPILFDKIDVYGVDKLLKRKIIYTRKETPWWEKHVGGFVMVRDKVDQQWIIDKFRKKIGDRFWCDHAYWYEMRSLTQSEKDAIITNG